MVIYNQAEDKYQLSPKDPVTLLSPNTSSLCYQLRAVVAVAALVAPYAHKRQLLSATDILCSFSFSPAAPKLLIVLLREFVENGEENRVYLRACCSVELNTYG